jgi:hypothetical protein
LNDGNNELQGMWKEAVKFKCEALLRGGIAESQVKPQCGKLICRQTFKPWTIFKIKKIKK